MRQELKAKILPVSILRREFGAMNLKEACSTLAKRGHEQDVWMGIKKWLIVDQPALVPATKIAQLEGFIEVTQWAFQRLEERNGFCFG
jgi:hypothetical protein